MRSDYDIINIMYGPDTAAEVDIYREPKSGLEPLLLDTVMQGPRASNCRLLQMPSEILAKIVGFIAEDDKALQQLALNMVDGYVGPHIGDCVRKFTFKPDPYLSRLIHSEAWERAQDDPGDEFEGTEEIKEEATSIFKEVQRVVAINVDAMRNLETLVWNCKFPIETEIFSVIAESTGHNLLINRALITEDFSLKPPMTPPSWPLRFLVLMNVRLVGTWNQEHDSLRSGEQRRPNPTNNFFRTLFQLCSPTLESLAWETWNREDWKPLSLETDSQSFPKLRQLRIKLDSDAIDEPSFASFLSAPLKSLQLDHISVRGFKDLIRSHVEEPYRDLEELVVDHDHDSQLITELIQSIII